MSTHLVTARWRGTAWHAEISGSGKTLSTESLHALDAAVTAELEGNRPNLVFRLGDELDEDLRRFSDLRYRADVTDDVRLAALARVVHGLDVLGLPEEDAAVIAGVKPDQYRRVLEAAV